MSEYFPASVQVRIVPAEERFSLAEDVKKLYLAAGWIGENEDLSTLPRLLENTFALCGAFASDGHMIGMMRALSDGVSDAYLLDMVVLPEYRRKKIASGILETMKQYLKSLGIDWIVCVSVPGAEKLYSSFGNVMENHVPFRF